ncbi:MAG: extracellular solute-binding protein [Spirochaetia bacterium]|jgi:ABC-type glycerol-3-phosphate transport system substrate-binding protein
MKRPFAKTLVLVLVILAVVGIQFVSAAPVKIRFAHMWQAGASEDADMTLAILQKAADANLQFELVNEVVVGDEMRNKIRVDVAANNAPDMWQFWVGGVLADYVKAGVLANMNDYLGKSKKVKKADIPESAWQTVTFDGIPRALPRNIALGVFMANRALFQKYGLKYPKTWAEFLAVGKAFRKNGVIPTNIGSKGGNPSHFWYGDLVCQYKSGLIGTQNMATLLNFKDPAFVKAAMYCQQMAENQMFPDDVMANGDWAPSIALFNQGNVAMCYTFPWMYAQISNEMADAVDIIPIPKLPDAERDPATFIQGTVNDAYCINAKSFADPKKQAGIVAFFDAVGWDIPLAESQSGFIVSVNNAVMKKVDLSKIPNKMAVKAIQFHLKNNVSGSPMIWQNLPDNKLQFDYQSALDELWSGSLNANQYIDKVQASIDEYKASR